MNHQKRLTIVQSVDESEELKRLRKENERIWQKIKKHRDDSLKTYGRRRITKCLKNEGEVIGKNRVSKLMKKNGIEGVGKKKFKPQTTTSNHAYQAALVFYLILVPCLT